MASNESVHQQILTLHHAGPPSGYWRRHAVQIIVPPGRETRDGVSTPTGLVRFVLGSRPDPCAVEAVLLGGSQPGRNKDKVRPTVRLSRTPASRTIPMALRFCKEPSCRRLWVFGATKCPTCGCIQGTRLGGEIELADQGADGSKTRLFVDDETSCSRLFVTVDAYVELLELRPSNQQDTVTVTVSGGEGPIADLAARLGQKRQPFTLIPPTEGADTLRRLFKKPKAEAEAETGPKTADPLPGDLAEVLARPQTMEIEPAALAASGRLSESDRNELQDVWVVLDEEMPDPHLWWSEPRIELLNIPPAPHSGVGASRSVVFGNGDMAIRAAAHDRRPCLVKSKSSTGDECHWLPIAKRGSCVRLRLPSSEVESIRIGGLPLESLGIPMPSAAARHPVSVYDHRELARFVPGGQGTSRSI